MSKWKFGDTVREGGDWYGGEGSREDEEAPMRFKRQRDETADIAEELAEMLVNINVQLPTGAPYQREAKHLLDRFRVQEPEVEQTVAEEIKAVAPDENNRSAFTDRFQIDRLAKAIDALRAEVRNK